MNRASKIHIDTAALAHNVQCIRQLASASKILAVVKADAYGHGLTTVASALQAHTDGFGVCCLEEALTIRKLGIDTPIVLLEGFCSADELPLLVQYDLQCVIHHHYQLDLLAQARLNEPLPVWLKVNTGMNRLGFSPEEVRQVWDRLQQCPSVRAPIRLMTHFADADKTEKSTTANQIRLFKQIHNDFPVASSLANSAAILAWPQSHAEWNRPGIMLYGVSPFADSTGRDHDLQPVMTLSSQLIAIRRCRKEAAVGYGGHWLCPEDMDIGIVAVGYADGYPRNAGNGTPVLVNGRIAPLAGRVSMDLLSVDLRQHPDAQIGDPVVLWGQGLPVETIAQYSDTIPYELLCHVSARVR